MKDYKEILEGVVNIINTTEKSDIGFANICAYIGENCPELKDSEDERIRKRIYNYINVTLDDNESEEKEKWLAWIEKQSEQILANSAKTCKDEQKPAGKIEPKFKVGDWICDDTLRIPLHVDEVLSDMYRLTDNTGKIYYKPKVEVEAVCRKFDVLKDAKKKEPKKIKQKSWSEVDNFMYNKIKNLLTDISLAPESIKSLFDWLKDLRDRVQPQNRWKPTKKQIVALRYVLNHLPYCTHKEEISGLLDQIKDL